LFNLLAIGIPVLNLKSAIKSPLFEKKLMIKVVTVIPAIYTLGITITT